MDDKRSGRDRTARATIPSVVVAGLGTYRRRFWRIALAAVVVFAPIDLVVTLATKAATDVAEKSDVFSKVVWSGGAALGVAGTALSLVFFAGVIDRIVAVDQKGEDDLPIRAVLRDLPTLRLIVAGVLATAITIVGLVLFLVPGLVLMVLFCVVGPVVVIEGAGAWRSLWRSAALVGPHFFLALVVIVLPTFAEESLTSWLDGFSWYEPVLVRVPVDVIVTLVVGGVVGVLEVTLAHALIADKRRRREAKAKVEAETASPETAAPAAGAAATAGRTAAAGAGSGELAPEAAGDQSADR
jgi:hypothetical protein